MIYVIYKIVLGDRIYIGKTPKNELNTRRGKHFYDSKKYPERKVYQHYKQIYPNNDNINHFKLEIIFEFEDRNINKLPTYIEQFFADKIPKDKLLNTIKCSYFNEEYKQKCKLEGHRRLYTYRKQKVNCKYCNSLVSLRNIATHMKSKKCMKIQEEQKKKLHTIII